MLKSLPVALLLLICASSIASIAVAASPAAKTTTRPFINAPPSEHNFSASTWIQAPSAHTSTNNLFRSPVFTVPYGTKSATLYWSGIGASELLVNGMRAKSPGGHENRLEPGATDFGIQTLYVAYDVLPYLEFSDSKRPRTNVIGIQLGNGWYGMKRAFNQVPKLRAELVVDGVTTIWTNGSWINARGPIGRNSIYYGEDYNASYEVEDWARAATPPANYVCKQCGPVMWLASQEVPASEFSPQLRMRKFAGVHVVETLTPAASWFFDPVTLVIDFGREISGVVRVVVNGTTGSVAFRHGEILNHYDPGMENSVYFANLRSAQATDTLYLPVCTTSWLPYTTYSPRFTFHGFRFVQVQNATGDIDLNFIRDNIVALSFHTASEPTSNFEFDSHIFNTLHSHILNVLNIDRMGWMADTCSRDERLAWLCDMWLSSLAQFQNFDIATFFENQLLTLVGDQVNGEVPDVSPFVRYGNRPADPNWGLAFPFLANAHYSHTGDLSSLQQFFGPTSEWLQYLLGRLQQSGMAAMYAYYGDWVPPSPAPRVNTHFTSAQGVLFTLNLLRSMCLPANNATYFATLTSALTTQYIPQFIAAFYNSSTQQFVGTNTLQAAYLFPMSIPGLFEAAPGANPDDLLNAIDMADGHFNTGIISLRLLFDTVAHRLGRLDTAVSILLQTSYPSYAWEWSGDLETPATALWEVWNAPMQGPAMNSRSHHMDSSADTFLAESLGGIKSAFTTSHTAIIQAASLSSSSSLSFAQLRELQQKYVAHRTLVVDLSVASFDAIPVRSAKSRKRLNKAGLVANFEWTRVGGSFCQHFSAVNQQQEKMEEVLTCGVGGGVISEIVDVVIGQPSGSCATLHHNADSSVWSIPGLEHHVGATNPSTQQIQQELIPHQRRIAREIAAACIGESSCTLPAHVTHAWRNGLPHINNNKTVNMYVRARCSEPAKIEARLTLSDPAHPYELFIPTFGFSNKAEITVTAARDGSSKVTSVEKKSDVVAAHPMVSITARGRTRGSLVLATGTGSVSVVIQEKQQQQKAIRHEAKKPLQQRLQRNSDTLNFGRCPADRDALTRIDRVAIDDVIVTSECRRMVSFSKLVSAIETQCIAARKASCEVSVKDVLVAGVEKLNNSEKCVEEIQQAVELMC